jgi:hypothetical protein
MINVTEYDVRVKKEYYRDQIRAAQRHNEAKRLLGSAQGQRPVARALTWLGSQLADWGESLQERYGTMVSPTLPQPR